MNSLGIARSLREQADLIENPPPWNIDPNDLIWHADGTDFPFQVSTNAGSAYVRLPHQCDDWVIADGPRAYVTEHLADFIRRAQAALDELNSLTEDE